MNQIKDMVTTQSPAFTTFVLHTKRNDAFDTCDPINPKNLVHLSPLSGFRARGSDFATRSAPAHYTAHHLHITWTDSTGWSDYSGLLKRLLKSSPAKTVSKEANCASVE